MVALRNWIEDHNLKGFTREAFLGYTFMFDQFLKHSLKEKLELDKITDYLFTDKGMSSILSFLNTRRHRCNVS